MARATASGDQVWMMIAARGAGQPGVRLPASAGAQIRGAKLVNPSAAEAEFEREIGGGKPVRAKLCEKMAALTAAVWGGPGEESGKGCCVLPI